MKIHVIEPLAVPAESMEQFKKEFAGRGHEVVSFPDRNEDPAEIIKRCEGAEVVVIGNLPFPEEVVSALTDLKMLAVAFTGVDHVAVNKCREKDIRICNASGYSTINVAELAVGMMLDLLRNITKLDPITRNGGTKDGYVGFDLAGKTVGIVGTGVIGTRVAKILQGFDVKLLGYDVTQKDEIKKYGVEYTDLDTLLQKSDIVTLHCPLNDSTRGLINSAKIALMKKSAYLVNCARGPVVKTADLAEALKNRTIAGAALDVFDVEPPLPLDTPFLSIENTIVTPHIAFASREAFLRRLDIVKNNINSWLDGSPENIIV